MVIDPSVMMLVGVVGSLILALAAFVLFGRSPD